MDASHIYITHEQLRLLAQAVLQVTTRPQTCEVATQTDEVFFSEVDGLKSALEGSLRVIKEGLSQVNTAKVILTKVQRDLLSR